ncbi:hypothetical protein [Bifidobacterium cuniculi]|uniref:Uncharacterized protein n=1 Tax=Bifidobacterium cuniculi TaxID=1688 RepID=A0A087B4E3_9BIFI|nr:hypothetical protein [Bifidobacterium cuniculi]KFI65893.1 hypothetical protein BCUN_0391 [Bifidobacterium cuniculi]
MTDTKETAQAKAASPAASTRDSRGNDLKSVEIPIGGAISLTTYDTANAIKPEAMAETKKTVTLPDAYNADSYVGLITSDGGPQDGRDGGDAVTFYQSGYTISGSSTLTTTFTVAENNRLVRRVTLGEPDANGVYAVDDIIQDEKWCAYQEETLKDGRIRRRAGVVQITGNEPAQSTNGEVKGTALTATWVEDDMYSGHKYIESIYDPRVTPSTGD